MSGKKKIADTDSVEEFSLQMDLPIICKNEDISSQAKRLALVMDSDFCVGDSFDAAFAYDLMYEGFFPFSMAFDDHIFFIPKLHCNRAILSLPQMVVPKSTVRQSKKYEFSMDRQFDLVLQKSVDYHGDGWLTEPLRRALHELRHSPVNERFRMHSIELWLNGEIVAGEIGYSLGTMYTSMTGYHLISGSGSVQLYAAGALLRSKGFRCIDYGEILPYKEDLGARKMSRSAFLNILHKLRLAQNPLAQDKTVQNIVPANSLLKLSFPLEYKKNTLDDPMDRDSVYKIAGILFDDADES